MLDNRTLRGWASSLLLLWVVLAALASAALLRAAWALPSQGPGGPILVITSPSAPFGNYYAEILRAEGLNQFTVGDPGFIDPAVLAQYDVVVLAKMALSADQVAKLNTWVNGGGNLIAMAPDAQLAPLLGLTPAGGSPLSNGYLLVDTTARPGNGIVGQTIQYHGSADRYTINGATQVATLFSNATTATLNPAVSLRTVGSGRAAAFTFDLATSIVQTRQGNPAWAAQERDGFTPIRSDDKFYGNAQGDPQPDWIDLDKVKIPQADELQRLFANLVLYLNEAKKPLPRFWYFPNGKKAVIVMTGDDHGNGGTAGRFEQFIAASPANCSVDNWECVRGTSYVYPTTPVSAAAASQYNALGFEVGLHVNTGCSDFDPVSLESFYTSQLSAWQSAFANLPAPSTQRHHCIVWSDWSTGAQVQLNHGMRLDTSYYYWPPSWANNVPGLFTGSAMPMRFSSLGGDLIDVYMAATQMTDESGQSYPFTPNALLDRALGAEGYYGAYVINAHTDVVDSNEASTTVASAQARGVSVISARQLLTWVDARNASSFNALGGNSSVVTFSITRAPDANGLQAMLPLRSASGTLASLTRAGTGVSFSTQTIKGVEYAFFAADGGSYSASYAADTTPPSVVSSSPANGAQAVAVGASVTLQFSEAMNPASLDATTFTLSDAGGATVGASVSYDAALQRATLRPASLLAGGQTYTVTVRGGAATPRATDVTGNPLLPYTGSFTTAAAVVCPCSGWPAGTAPANATANDPNGVELGVKFTTDVGGSISGLRFYKGGSNTGTHVGNLWSASGQLLASATFVGESASGWQQVAFATPVPVTPDTVYVASYYAPNGGYAFDYDYFAASGVDNGPVNFLRDGDSGGNGVYQYGSQSTFPTETWRSSNYWVDVVFTTGTPPAGDTTPPTVSGTTPAAGATGVSAGAAVSVTFSEAMAASSIGSGTIELRDAANAPVGATVSYAPATRIATLAPTSPLNAGATYTATVKGGAADPRVKDMAGNALAADVTWSFTIAAPTGACASPANAIVAENCLPGSPASEWDISGIGDATLQGYATEISVNRGSTVSFKVDTNASAYRFDIYRLGYYGGLGARKVATVLPSASLPQAQPGCLTEASTGLIDCGNWAVSGSWAVPSTATSGIYIAKLVRADTGGASHILFVVRNDASTSDLLFQTSDTTWQAYNNYGGNSLYTGGPAASPSRAYKVSYNRPFVTRGVDGGQDWVFNAEYPMLRFLEGNGYDLSYAAGADTDRSPGLLLNHKTFLSVGHDEYWSGGQRSAVEAARNAGVNLAFFSGNEVFWKTRWENAIDASGASYRTLVCYKETHANAKIDPTSAWTGTWRDPRFSPPADGNRPENGLTGTLFMINNGATTSISVPEADGKMRFWRNTSVATLASGGSATLPDGVLGYEWDVDADNGSRPAGLVRLSTTVRTLNGSFVLQDYGSTYGAGTVNHALSLYRHPTSRALVFGAGTVQWTWGLDSNHDRGNAAADPRMQQATVNLLADMKAQPGTLQSGLVAATASTDSTAPASAITAPAAGATVQPGTTVTISGTATDAGGGSVGGVEVSTDGGTTWRAASGRASWTYSWTTPASGGTATIRTRAVDDSGNLESPAAGRSVTVGTPPDTTPPTVSAVSPAAGATGVAGTANVTATFSEAMTASTISGSTVQLRTAANALVAASVSYNASTRVVTLDPTPTLTAGAVYTVTIVGGASGVKDSAGNALAANVTSSFTVFIDTTPPTVTAVSPTAGATGIATTTNVTATFSEAMTAATISASTVTLRDAANALVAAGVSYNATTRVVTLDPTPTLNPGAVYSATITGGASGVKDAVGNALASNQTWSFTTLPDTTPPTVTSISPASGATGVSRTGNVTVTFSEAMDAATISASTFVLTTSTGAVVASTVSYNATTRVATLNPNATLGSLATYTVTVRGGATDPRVKDAAGNALAATRSWTFRTSLL